MDIGFNSGSFWRFYLDRFSVENISALSVPDARVLELSCRDEKMVDQYINEDLAKYSNFEIFTIHAPIMAYGENETTYRVFDKINLLARKFNARNIVFHPEPIPEWSVFDRLRDLPVSIENMDETRMVFRSVSEMKELLAKYKFGLTLDLQHCFVNDNTMKLAADFHEALGDRIVEYHISAYSPVFFHVPLYNSNQDVIIRALKNKNAIIMIESTFDKPEDAAMELAYLKNKLE